MLKTVRVTITHAYPFPPQGLNLYLLEKYGHSCLHRNADRYECLFHNYWICTPAVMFHNSSTDHCRLDELRPGDDDG